MKIPVNTGLFASGSLRKQINMNRCFPYLLLWPSVVLILAISVIPSLNVFNLSLQNLNYSRLFEAGYAGLENFKKLLTEDKQFINTIPITLKWVGLVVFFQLFCGLFISLTHNESFKGRGLARSIVFMPWAVSGVLTATLWSLMLNQHVGILNDMLIKLGLIKENIAWVANWKTVFGSVVAADVWRGVPFFAIVLLASLQGIPNELYESSEIDGGSRFGKFWYITLPYLKDTIVLTTLLRCIWSFNAVDTIFTLTGGGPFYTTTTLSIYLVNTAVVGGNYGYGAAIAVVMFFVLVLFSILYTTLNKYGSGVDDAQ